MASSAVPEAGHAHEATSAAIAAELLSAPVAAAQAADSQPMQARQTPLPGMLASVPPSKPPRTPAPTEPSPQDTREVILATIRELDPRVKADVRRMLRTLFSTGAAETVRSALAVLAKLGKPE